MNAIKYAGVAELAGAYGKIPCFVNFVFNRFSVKIYVEYAE